MRHCACGASGNIRSPPCASPPTRTSTISLLLAETEAVAVFVARAQDVRPDFALTADNAAAIAEICVRLDGLPLALELAAARVKVLPPAMLLARLEARLPLLTGGTRDAPERQRSLRDAIAWSHDLLTPAEQTLFRRLGVFVGGWTLEAAEAVVDVDGDLDVVEGLGSLADKSLVRLDESELRAALPDAGDHPRVRAGAARRQRRRQPRCAQMHAAYFLRLAEQSKPFMYGAGQRDWLRTAGGGASQLPRGARRARRERRPRRRTCAWPPTWGDFWFRRSHFVEGRAHLEAALAHAVAPTPQRAEALKWLGAYRLRAERLRRCRDLAAAERSAGALAQPPGRARAGALFARGGGRTGEGDDDRAVALYEAALAVARELNDAHGAGAALNALSDAAYRRGDLETAERLGAEAVALLRSIGDAFELSLGLTNIGAVALAWGDTPRAVVAYQEALELALGIEADWVIANALAGFAAVAAARGDHAGAAQLLGATETAARSQSPCAHPVFHPPRPDNPHRACRAR